tara:strand:+ start:674 stop:943 length:270 start_codon:yes stop_codon:yes gene_type:complete
MNKNEDLERFYQDAIQMISSTDDLSASGKTIVLFRVAMESGAAEIGVAGVLHLLSRLMSATLGIMNGVDTDDIFEDILDDFNTEYENMH